MCEGTFFTVGVWFTVSTLAAASLRLIGGVSVTQGKAIPLSTSVEFLTGPENSATVVLYCADHRLTVIVRILLLTVYHIYTGVFSAPVTGAVAAL